MFSTKTWLTINHRYSSSLSCLSYYFFIPCTTKENLQAKPLSTAMKISFRKFFSWQKKWISKPAWVVMVFGEQDWLATYGCQPQNHTYLFVIKSWFLSQTPPQNMKALEKLILEWFSLQHHVHKLYTPQVKPTLQRKFGSLWSGEQFTDAPCNKSLVSLILWNNHYVFSLAVCGSCTFLLQYVKSLETTLPKVFFTVQGGRGL